MSKSVLFVVWAGGGNVPPQLALARRLAARGHRVRMLAPTVLRQRIEKAGVAYEPYSTAPEHDEGSPTHSLVRDFEQRSPVAAIAAVRERLLAGMAHPIALDVLSVLERHPVDAVASDFTLFGALFAAERMGIPAAMLVHTVYPFPPRIGHPTAPGGGRWVGPTARSATQSGDSCSGGSMSSRCCRASTRSGLSSACAGSAHSPSCSPGRSGCWC